jgi:hypothetical protein
MAALPGLGYWRASVISQASTARRRYVAPGGAAVGIGLAFAMLRGWGFASAAVTLAVTLTGVWNQLFMLFAPAVALALLTFRRGLEHDAADRGRRGLRRLLVAIGAFVAALASNELARKIGDVSAGCASRGLAVIGKGRVIRGTAESLVRFRHPDDGLLRRRWLPLTLATCAGQLTVFAVLVVCLRTLGVDGSEVTLTEAFAGGRSCASRLAADHAGRRRDRRAQGSPVRSSASAARTTPSWRRTCSNRVVTVVPTLVLGVVAGALWRRLRPGPHERAPAG